MRRLKWRRALLEVGLGAVGVAHAGWMLRRPPLLVHIDQRSVTVVTENPELKALPSIPAPIRMACIKRGNALSWDYELEASAAPTTP
jgi:hypothetical protein